MFSCSIMLGTSVSLFVAGVNPGCLLDSGMVCCHLVIEVVNEMVSTPEGTLVAPSFFYPPFGGFLGD